MVSTLANNTSAVIALRTLGRLNSNPAPSNTAPLSSNHLPVRGSVPTDGQTSTRLPSNSIDTAYWSVPTSSANSADAANGENDGAYFKDVVGASGVGSLVDADMEEEAIRLKALQTQQRLAIQSLSISNNNASAIMTMFRG